MCVFKKTKKEQLQRTANQPEINKQGKHYYRMKKKKGREKNYRIRKRKKGRKRNYQRHKQKKETKQHKETQEIGSGSRTKTTTR